MREEVGKEEDEGEEGGGKVDGVVGVVGGEVGVKDGGGVGVDEGGVEVGGGLVEEVEEEVEGVGGMR